jgi:hypothetical protein
MHDPCACRPLLEWDEVDKVYFPFFLSCNGKTKTNIWMTRPTSDLATINYNCGEKKRKDRREKDNEEKKSVKDQESAQNHSYRCRQHAKVAKKEHVKYKKQVSRQKEKTKEFVDEREQCIHSDEDPCVFTQIEMRLCKNDEIYYNGGDYEKAPISYNRVVGENVLSSTLPSYCGRVSTTKDNTTGVLKTVFVLFSLPLMAKQWVSKKKNNLRFLVMKYT